MDPTAAHRKDVTGPRGEIASWVGLGLAPFFWAGLVSAAFHDLRHVTLNAWFGSFDLSLRPTSGASKDLTRMHDFDRDSEITINVGFGNITFCRDDTGPFAKVIVDIVDAEKPADRIEMTVAVPADPHLSIVEVVEKSRLHIIAMLQAALDRVETESADSLLYG